MRETVSQVHDALTELAKGYDLEAALKGADVSFVAGSTGKANGHAWQSDGKGYFSISPAKRGIAGDAEQKEYADARAAAGKGHWSISTRPGIDARESARSTIVHEFAHALGMQKHIDSPIKLRRILEDMHNGDRQAMTVWIRDNVSEYALHNIKETDAELAALVTSPLYVRGTLPEVIENHVDELFKRRK